MENVGASDAWAVGGAGSIRIDGGQKMILHWDGRAWRRVRSVQGSLASLWALSASSRRDVWAVGGDGKNPLALHWNGSRWRAVPTPRTRASNELLFNDVATVAPDDAWAVVGYARQPLVEHWDGKSWKVDHTFPTSTIVNAIDASSEHNVWAVGTRQTPDPAGRLNDVLYHPLAMRWKATWTKAVLPGAKAQQGELLDVAVVSNREAWAVGLESDPALRWQTRGWTRQPTLNRLYRGSLDGASASRPSNTWVWSTHDPPFIGRWNGRTWQAGPRVSDRGKQHAEIQEVEAISDHAIWVVAHYGEYEASYEVLYKYTRARS